MEHYIEPQIGDIVVFLVTVDVVRADVDIITSFEHEFAMVNNSRSGYMIGDLKLYTEHSHAILIRGLKQWSIL